MRFIIISLINFYQRVLSSRKGFCCAHHRVHGGDTCSNAVKNIVLENGFFASISKTKHRFNACREASIYLANQADIPCDVPCDISFDVLGCGGGGNRKSCDVVSLPCDFLGSCGSRSGKYSRTERSVFWTCFLLLAFSASYWFYGRGIATIYVMPLSESSKFSAKMWQRKTPDLRIMIEVNGAKIYSNIINDVNLTTIKKPLKFSLKQVAFDYPQSIELHDARLKIGGDLLVAGEVLEVMSQPRGVVEGKRFRYTIKRRWGF